MDSLSVVLYQNDLGTAQSLAVNLSQYFDTVQSVQNCAEIGPRLPCIVPMPW